MPPKSKKNRMKAERLHRLEDSRRQKMIRKKAEGSVPAAPVLDESSRRWTLVVTVCLALCLAIAALWPSYSQGVRLHAGEMAQLLPTRVRGVIDADDWSSPTPFLRTTAVSLPPGLVRMRLDGLAEGKENTIQVQMLDGWGSIQDGPRLRIPPEGAPSSQPERRAKPISFMLPPDAAMPGNRTVRFEISYGGQGRLEVRDLVALVEDDDEVAGPLVVLIMSVLLCISCLSARGRQVQKTLSALQTYVRSRSLRLLVKIPTLGVFFSCLFGFIWAGAERNDFLLNLSEAENSAFNAEMVLMAALAAIIMVGDHGVRGALRCWAVALAFCTPFILLGNAAASREELVLDGSCAPLAALKLAILLALMEVLSPYLLKGRERLQAWLFTAVEFIALACPAVALIYWAVFGQMFSTPAIEAIWQTNPHEALRFASAYVPHLIALAAAVAGGLYGLYRSNLVRVRRIRDRHESLFTPAAIGFLALDMAIVLASLGMDAWGSPAVRELRATADYFQRISPRPTFDLSSVKRPDAPAPRTRIIAIGESAGRDRHSLYGYGKATTPWMDAMARKGGLVAFANAYAGNKYTYHALEMALTEADQYDGRRFEESRSLVEVMRAAGATVTWLSNQERDFNRGMPFGIMASSCDAAFWTDRPGESHDMDLVRLLKERVDPSKDNLVIVHMNGSHLVYGDRTPEGERVFGKEERNVSNDYDDSVLYTDRTLKALFEYAQGNLNLESFIYLSDHGEVPGVPRDTFRWGMARIPFALWLSDEYRAAHPDIVRRLESRRDAWWTNDLLFDLALGLYGVRMEGMEPDKDLSSEAWSMDPMKMTTENGRHYLVNDPGIPAR